MKNKKSKVEEVLQFPNIELFEQLPCPIKEVVSNFCKMAPTKQNNFNVPGYTPSETFGDYITKTWLVFTDESTHRVWQKLLSLNSKNVENASIKHFTIEMRAQKIAQVLLHMKNHKEFVFDQFNYCQWHIKNKEPILNKIRSLIKAKQNYLLSASQDQFLAANDTLLNHLIEEEKKEIADIQRLKDQLGDIRRFQTEFMPVTRQSNGTGEATLSACFLHVAFKRLYGKPRHADVAILVNALHKSTRYTEKCIAAMVRRSKKLEMNKIALPLQGVFEGFLRSGIANNGLCFWITSAMKNESSL